MFGCTRKDCSGMYAHYTRCWITFQTSRVRDGSKGPGQGPAVLPSMEGTAPQQDQLTCRAVPLFQPTQREIRGPTTGVPARLNRVQCHSARVFALSDRDGDAGRQGVMRICSTGLLPPQYKAKRIPFVYSQETPAGTRGVWQPMSK